MSDNHEPYPNAEVLSIEKEAYYLDRLARRIVYLKRKAIELAGAGLENKYELAEMEATKWAFNEALSRHRTHKRFFAYLVKKFPQKMEP